MYESLRQLILASQSSDADAVFSAMDLAFAIDLCKEEGGGQVRQCTAFSDWQKKRINLFCFSHVERLNTLGHGERAMT